jgi:O-antigen/teichoic acid export membrane protein
MTVDTLGLRVRMAQPIRTALRSDFLRHSALVFVAAMAGNVLNYLFNFALSRRLGVEGFATLSSLTSFLMLLSIPTAVLTLIVVKYAAVYHAAGDAQRIRRLSYVLLKSTGIAGLLVFAAGALLRSEIAAFLRIPNDGTILFCLGIMAFGLVAPSVRGILQGEQDFVRYGISTVLEAFLKVLVAVAFVYAGYGVAGAMGGWIVGTACSLTYTIWAVLLKHGVPPERSVRLALDLRRLSQTTIGVGLATGFLTCISFMDVLLVKHYFEPHQAGLYAAVNLTGKVVLFLAGFVPAVLLPKAAARAARGENANALLIQAVSITAVMAGLALLIFGSMPAEVIRLLAGRDFIAGAPYVLQYDAAMALLAMLTLIVNYSIGIHRFGFLYALGVVLAGEIVGIVALHASLWNVVHVLLLGNAVAVAVCGVYAATRRVSALQTDQKVLAA